MRIATLLIVLLMAGCATGNPVQVADIKVASPQAVAACDYRDTVHGTSGLYGMFAEKGIENARLSAFDKARQLGATHLVWEPAMSQTFGSSNVAAKFNRCGA